MVHHGDNLTGGGEGDDEQETIALDKIDADIRKIVVILDIYKAKERGQTFGDLANAFVRIVDMTSEKELVRFDIDADAVRKATGLQFVTLLRTGEGWVLQADEKVIEGGLGAMCNALGASTR